MKLKFSRIQVSIISAMIGTVFTAEAFAQQSGGLFLDTNDPAIQERANLVSQNAPRQQRTSQQDFSNGSNLPSAHARNQSLIARNQQGNQPSTGGSQQDSSGGQPAYVQQNVTIGTVVNANNSAVSIGNNNNINQQVVNSTVNGGGTAVASGALTTGAGRPPHSGTSQTANATANSKNGTATATAINSSSTRR